VEAVGGVEDGAGRGRGSGAVKVPRVTPSWTMRVSWAMRSAMWQSTTAPVPPVNTLSVANSWVACLVPLGGEQARQPVPQAVLGRPVLGDDSGQVHDLGSPCLSSPRDATELADHHESDAQATTPKPWARPHDRHDINAASDRGVELLLQVVQEGAVFANEALPGGQADGALEPHRLATPGPAFHAPLVNHRVQQDEPATALRLRRQLGWYRRELR